MKSLKASVAVQGPWNHNILLFQVSEPEPFLEYFMAVGDRVPETQDLNLVFSQFALKINNFSFFRQTFQICILHVEASIL